MTVTRVPPRFPPPPRICPKRAAVVDAIVTFLASNGAIRVIRYTGPKVKVGPVDPEISKFIKKVLRRVPE